MANKENLFFLLKAILLGLAIAGIYLLIISWQTHSGSSKNITTSFHDAVARSAPAVVNVYASELYEERLHPLFDDPLFKQFFGEAANMPRKRRENLQGSGVIIDTRGYLLTNAHVIKNANDIRVTLANGRQGKAKVIGIDQDTDLAVLKMNMENLPEIPMGNSDQLRIGDIVLAIGNPFNVGQTVTQGIVSATGRQRVGITTFEDFIQTDADINPGNSGGALINAYGELIGINTAIISSDGSSQGISLATPINQALDIVQQLITNGFVMRGWLGIEAQIISPDILQSAGVKGGVIVSAILQQGPAEHAGIIPGDIITHIAGEVVTDPKQTIDLITKIPPGSSIDIQILRGWEQQTLRAKVAQRPPSNLRNRS